MEVEYSTLDSMIPDPNTGSIIVVTSDLTMGKRHFFAVSFFSISLNGIKTPTSQRWALHRVSLGYGNGRLNVLCRKIAIWERVTGLLGQ